MPRRKQKITHKRVVIVFFVIVAFLGILFFSKVAAYIKPLFELAFERKIELKKTNEEKINILLLGIGGGSHDGPLLTDTIMFASIDPLKPSINLISIPRDLWVDEMSST